MKYFVDYLPVTKGNKTTLYTDGKDYCLDLEAALRNAQKLIFLTGLHFMSDFRLTRPSPKFKSHLVQILQEAGDRGVKVFLLVNQFWKDEQEVPHKIAPIRKAIMKGGELVGYLPETYKLFESLGSNPNIVCRTDLHPNPVFGTHHQKTVIIDEKIAFLGGVDLTYLDGDRWDTHDHRVDERAVDRTQKYWHDVHMRLEGPAVEFVRDNFYQRWDSGDLHNLKKTWIISKDQTPLQIIVGVRDKRTPSLPALTTTAKYEYPTGKETAETPTVQIVRSMPGNRFYSAHKPKWNKQKEDWEHSCKDAYLLGIRAAKKYIYIENQWISDEDMWRELKNAAQRNRDNHDFRILLVVPYLGLFAAGLGSNQELWIGSEMEEVAKALGSHDRFGMYGLVRRWNRDNSFDQIYVHSKVMIVDDEWALIGSANAGGISLEGIRSGRDRPDSELSAITLDSKFAKNFRKKLWSEHLLEKVGDDYDPKDVDRFKEQAEGSNRYKVRFFPRYASLFGKGGYPIPIPSAFTEQFKRESGIASSLSPEITEPAIPPTLVRAAFRVQTSPDPPAGYRLWYRWKCEVGYRRGNMGDPGQSGKSLMMRDVRDDKVLDLPTYTDCESAYIGEKSAEYIDRNVADVAPGRILCRVKVAPIGKGREKPPSDSDQETTFLLEYECMFMNSAFAKANHHAFVKYTGAAGFRQLPGG